MIHFLFSVSAKRRSVITLMAWAPAAVCFFATAAWTTAADDEVHAAIVGTLVHTRVDVELHDQPARECFAMLGDAIGWTILDYWSEQAQGEAARPQPRVSIRARDVSALLALETMLAQIAVNEPVTWQVGPGVIEVGTKARLAARGPGETRLYPLGDLTLDIPYFQGPDLRPGAVQKRPDGAAFNNHAFRAAALKSGFINAQSNPQRQALARGFVDLIEPGNWDFGDELEGVLPGDPRYDAMEADAASTRLAQLRFAGDSGVSILAPDYMHRALGGYPKPAIPAVRPSAPPAGDEAHNPSKTDEAHNPPADYIRFVRVDPLSSAEEPSPPAARDRRMASPPREVFLTDLRTSDGARQRLAKAIESTVVPVHFDAMPAREAFDEFIRLSGIPLIVRYADQISLDGISPDTLISLRAESLKARIVLEAMVRQCSRVGEDCTWQIRLGFIEVGSKTALSVNAARELRVYNIRSLMIDVPDFHPNPAKSTPRRPSEFAALNLVETIVGTVEPQAWDWGQPLPPVEYEFGLDGVPMRRVRGRDPLLDAAAGNAPASGARWYVEHPRPAIIRYWGDVIIVHAPDFIHRQLAGYGPQPK